MKRKTILYRTLLILILTSCVSTIDESNSDFPSIASEDPLHRTPTQPSPTQQISISDFPSSWRTPTPFRNSPFEKTPPPNQTPISSIWHQSTCPEPIAMDSKMILSDGSIIFSLSSFNLQGGIWAASNADTTPKLIIEETEVASAYRIYISQDGKNLAWHIYRRDLEYPLVGIYDISTNDLQTYDVGIPWGWLDGYTNDNRIKLGQDDDVVKTDSIHRKYVLFDPTTLKIEHVEIDLLLPGLYLHDAITRTTTFSEHPDGRYTIYTALINGDSIVTLRDLKNGINVWEFRQDNWGLLPTPAWSRDGSKAALSVWSEEGGAASSQLFILRTDGLSTRVLPQVFFEDFGVSKVRWSPDDNFLYVSLQSTTSLDRSDYILNLQTDELKAICDPSMEEFYRGEWVGSENQFAYSLRLLDGSNELRILDVESWTWQTIFSVKNSPSSEPFMIQGWTPITLR